jgi:hypothetical protein
LLLVLSLLLRALLFPELLFLLLALLEVVVMLRGRWSWSRGHGVLTRLLIMLLLLLLLLLGALVTPGDTSDIPSIVLRCSSGR